MLLCQWPRSQRRIVRPWRRFRSRWGKLEPIDHRNIARTSTIPIHTSIYIEMLHVYYILLSGARLKHQARRKSLPDLRLHFVRPWMSRLTKCDARRNSTCITPSPRSKRRVDDIASRIWLCDAISIAMLSLGP